MPAPIDNYTYAEIAKKAVEKESGIDYHNLNIDDNDPIDNDNYFHVPYYEIAIDWYLMYFPRYNYKREEDKVWLVKKAYDWVLKGYLLELNNQANNLALPKKDRLSYLAHEQETLKCLTALSVDYISAFNKLCVLPERIQHNNPTHIELYKNACQGAVKIITEGLLSISQYLTEKSSQTENLTNYSSFIDLFVNPDDVERCVDLLRKCPPENPVLGIGLNWTGKEKGKSTLFAWIAAMETTDKIHILKNRKQLAKLLNEHFSNLDLGKHGRSFDNVADLDAKDKFVALMAN